VPHGPVVDALLDRGFAVHAINPKQLDRLRDCFSVAGAKDDRRDARVTAAGLRTDPHLFRPVRAGDPGVIELREWSRLAEELQQERVRLGNRIHLRSANHAAHVRDSNLNPTGEPAGRNLDKAVQKGCSG
jgi:transposase